VKAQDKLRNPTWVLGLGRKSYLPAEPVYLLDGLSDLSLREALSMYPFLGSGTPPQSLLYSFESTDGTGRMIMDQPLSSFAERQFGSRFVISEMQPFAQEATYAAS
jgi:CRISPR system Cascade subunit CasD